MKVDTTTDVRRKIYFFLSFFRCAGGGIFSTISSGNTCMHATLNLPSFFSYKFLCGHDHHLSGQGDIMSREILARYKIKVRDGDKEIEVRRRASGIEIERARGFD